MVNNVIIQALVYYMVIFRVAVSVSLTRMTGGGQDTFARELGIRAKD